MEDFPRLPALAAERPTDTLLLAFASIIETGTITSMGVSVNIDGAIFSGLLVSRAAWFESMSEANEGMVAQLINSISMNLEDIDNELRADGETVDPAFLHLQDVRLIAGSTASSIGYWRCRIADVGAWSLNGLRSVPN